MSRKQQTDVINQASGENQTYNQNAQTSFDATQQDVDSYGKAVGSFQAANPYVNGGAAETAVNQQIADTAAGQAQRLNQTLQGSAVRGGQNPGAAIAAGKEITAENTRAAMGQEASATESRLGKRATYSEAGVGMLGKQEGMQDKIAQEQAAAAQGALSTQETASQQPSFLETENAAFNQAGIAYLSGGGCPAEGSYYLMADGHEKRVENLTVGEFLMGIDAEPEEIKAIQSEISPVLRIETENGFFSRVSRVHAYALPAGGFVVAINALGKTLLTCEGKSKVIRVVWIGKARVFNVITDGSHTYRADGVWALGVGEAESQIDMATWNTIGDKLAAKPALEACHG